MIGTKNTRIIENYNFIKNNINEIRKNAIDKGFINHNHIVELLIVTKNRSVDEIKILLDAGHRVFGENKVQEAKIKWPDLKIIYPDIQLHMIGPLQTNKVKDALEIFNVIESIDRQNMIDKILSIHKNLDNYQFFIQLNSGEEKQKSGIYPQEFENLYNYCIDNNLNISGIMNIPPVNEDPISHFALTKEIAHKYKLKYLSYGMSQDYTKAIMKGDNIVRIGSAIFI